MRRDNSTAKHKSALRHMALGWVDTPVIMETHGGAGLLYQACYRHVERGVVFERDKDKVDILVRQRPSWSVYQADCVQAIRAGAGAHLPVNFVDIDPWGSPWETIDALFGSARPRPAVLVLVVTDGLVFSMRREGAWHNSSLREAVLQFGNEAVMRQYLPVARWMLERKAAQVGYAVSRFVGYHCGAGKQMTHYAVSLECVGSQA